MAELPTGTVTFLFTDIEGSTRLERELRERYGQVLAEHQRLLREVFASHGGHEVDTQGDSFFYVFPRAKAAVEAAIDAQRALAAHPWPESGAVRVRIGINTGEASLEHGRYVGFAVHRAARISAAAHGGQILLSSSTRELVEHDLPPAQVVRDLGERRLKDLSRPERIYQLVVDDLPSDFPPPRTLDEQELAEAARDLLTRKRYRRRTVLAVPAALLLGAAAAFLLTRESAEIEVEPNSVAIIDPDSNKAVDSVSVGLGPDAVAVGEGSAWVANTEDQTVSRLDVRTRRVVRTIPVRDYPSDLAVTAGSTWVALGARQQAQRIAVDHNEAEEPFLAVGLVLGEVAGREVAATPPRSSCDAPHTRLTAGAGAVWLACYSGQGADVSRIDPRTNSVTRVDEALFTTTGLDVSLSDIAVGLGSVWIANVAANVVIQIDARTGRRAREINVGRSPEAVAVGFGAIWVANSGDDTVSRIEVAGVGQPSLVEPIAVGNRPVDVSVGKTAVWVVNRADRSVSRIDPEVRQVTETIELENEPIKVAASSGLVWVTVQEPQRAGS